MLMRFHEKGFTLGFVGQQGETGLLLLSRTSVCLAHKPSELPASTTSLMWSRTVALDQWPRLATNACKNIMQQAEAYPESAIPIGLHEDNS